jgi:taurine--2-oxoglutarate transaminase
MKKASEEPFFFTWTAQRAAQPLEIVSGKGARFTTADGGVWWDLGSTTWNATLGHGHAGMKAALERGAGLGFVAGPTAVFPEKRRAAELLLEVAPGMAKAFLCLSGAEANENAIKMARLVTGKKQVVTRAHSYHGATFAMLELSGDYRRTPFFPTTPERLADPYCYRCPMGKERASCALECADDLERMLAANTDVAAVLVEGVTGANGVFVWKPGYWRRLREICDRHGVLLIADEVLSGFGRTGKWFAVDHDGVQPDMITCAKGLTAGYAPGGATLVSKRISDHFDDAVLSAGLTTYGHPMVCAAIVGAIEAYRDEKVIENAARVGEALSPRFAAALERPYVGEARGIGLLWALELVIPGSKVPLAAETMARVWAAIRAHRIHTFKRDNLVYYAPPLNISLPEAEEALGDLLAAIDEGVSKA